MSKVITMPDGDGSVEKSDAAVESRDHRVDRRRRLLKSGVVAYAGRTCTIACCVRDASTDGARLRVDGAIAVPDTFELFVELDGTWVDCEVVWRHGKDVGVRYTSDVKHGNATRRQVVDAPPVPERALKFPVRRSRP